ncbi:hypothetical protein F4604DRAFT_1690656 [Suillus subluteus]|nr:hypothetical protein F4604DRAFT_1690656 [Suillus subluteus]
MDQGYHMILSSVFGRPVRQLANPLRDHGFLRIRIGSWQVRRIIISLCILSFATQKRLSSHEAQCPANKSLDADIYKSQRRLEKEKRKKKKRRRLQQESRSPTIEEQTPPTRNLPPADEQMDIDDGWYNTDEVENDAPGPSNAGPSSIVPDPLVDSTISVRSGRQIRMPAQYADYIPSDLPSIPSASPPLPQGTPPAVQEHPVLVPYQTAPDTLGLFRVYPQ